MARLRIIVVAQETDGDVYALATCKFYAPGTATASGSSTSGTPFASNLYAAIAGGSPISTTQALSSSGTLTVWTDTKSRVDVGIQPANGGTAFVRQYESMEFDPADVMTSVSGEQSVMQTGTLAAPSIAQTGNLDTGFNVDSGGDPAVVRNGIGLLEATSTTTVLRSPAGTGVFTLTDGDGTAFTPAYFMRSPGWYDVRTYGVTMNDSSSGVKASNAAALSALPATIASAGGDGFGKAVAPAGDIHTNQFTWNHGLTSAKRISFEGVPGATNLKLYGSTSGVDIDVASGSTSPLAYCEWKNLVIYNYANKASGATLRLGYTSTFSLKNVILVDGGSGLGPFIGLQMWKSASVKAQDCVFVCKDTANAVAVDFAQDTAGGSGFFYRCQISGDAGVAAASKNSRGVRFNNTALVDTPIFTDTTIIDHYLGMVHGAGGTGGVQNLQFNGGFFDKSQYNVIVSATGGAWSDWNFSNVWMGATVRNVSLDTSGGMTAGGWTFNGGSWRNTLTGATSTTNALLATGLVSGLTVKGVTINTSSTTDASTAGLAFTTAGGAAPKRVVVDGNTIYVGAASAGAASFSAESTFHFGGGYVVGARPTYAGALSSARVFTDYGFAAS